MPILPKTFLETLAGTLCILGCFVLIFSLYEKIRTHAIRLLAILFITSLVFFANNIWSYVLGIVIIATSITETEFLQNIMAILSRSKPYFDYKQATAGQIKPSEENRKPSRTSMEYKVLNTLWTKQVNKFPDFNIYFTFLINAQSIEYVAFRQAGAKLMGEGLVGETDNGYYHLTRTGWDYCKQHFKDFPPDQWWPEETIDPKQLEKVVSSK